VLSFSPSTISSGPRFGLSVSTCASVHGLRLGGGRLEQRRARGRHGERRVELLRLVLAHGVGEAEAELLERQGNRSVPVGRVAEDGPRRLQRRKRQRQHAAERRRWRSCWSCESSQSREGRSCSPFSSDSFPAMYRLATGTATRYRGSFRSRFGASFDAGGGRQKAESSPRKTKFRSLVSRIEPISSHVRTTLIDRPSCMRGAASDSPPDPGAPIAVVAPDSQR
jgi:hypothetical protein